MANFRAKFIHVLFGACIAFLFSFANARECSDHFSQTQNENIHRITGLTRYDVLKFQERSISISSIEEILEQGIPQHSILLGPSGRLYQSLIKKFQLNDFWQAHTLVNLNPLKQQTEEVILNFFTKLTRRYKGRIYFLIPENYEQTNITKDEIKVLLSNPELMESIHFIYAEQVQFSQVELATSSNENRMTILKKKLLYHFRNLIWPERQTER